MRAFEPLPPAAILVVDDEPVISRLVVRYLRHLGYTVLEASSGEEALDLVRQRRPPIDLVLSDVMMPCMRGTELATWVLAECPGPQMMLMSGQLPDEIERLHLQGRIVRLLRKPLDLDQLRELLHGMLEHFTVSEELEPHRLVG